MTKHSYLLLVIFLLSFTSVRSYAQLEDLECGTTSYSKSGESHLNLSQFGGIYMTAENELRVLVVFASFLDDDSPHPYWPAHSPPDNMSEFIDPDMTTGTTRYANFTHYFDAMSLGLFEVTGEAVYVETPNNQSYYGSNRALGNKEILENLENAVGPSIDLNDYDNWQNWASTADNYDIQPEADGIVDLIVIIWRGLVWASWGGEASLGYSSSFQVDGKTIAMGYPYFSSQGSGVTVHSWEARNENYMFKNAIHEIGHWLIGKPHPYGSSNPTYSFWGMLTHPFDGISTNSFERERLAWINAVNITGTVTANLADYLTTGIAYKYHPSNGASNEYYYFENHQKLDAIYDDATVNSNDKGIFLIHQKDLYNDQNNIRIKTAGGDWNWEHALTTNECPSSPNLPAFRKIFANTSGTNHRATQPVTGGGWQWVYATADDDDNVYCGNFRRGENLDDSFNPSITKVFSPWSNPNTDTWSGNDTDFGMEILNQNGSVVNVKFYVGNPEDGPPAKPMDLTATASGTYAPVVLNWEANTEPDMVSGGKYKIFRAANYSSTPPTGGYSLIATINAYAGGNPVTAYTDNDVFAYPSSMYVHYYIRARDNTSKESTNSNSASYNAVLFKTATGEEVVITRYSLKQNYPNPFNPTTTIAFALPNDSPVRLTVFDSNGRQIAELVNEQLSAGSYEIPFDASALSSGVYFYRLTAGTAFTQTNKMMLLK